MGYSIQGALNSTSQIVGGAIKLGHGKDEECKKHVFKMYRYMTGIKGSGILGFKGLHPTLRKH